MKSETSISPTSLASSVRKPGTSRLHMMWVNVLLSSGFVSRVTEVTDACFLSLILQKRRGMDIKQMKTFVSEELKGLKQEHRLLSLRECQSSILYCT